MGDTAEQARWLRETVGIRALPMAAIRVTGEDARSWLNGQITNDMSRTEPGDAVYALAVDTKGKIASDLWALDLGEDGFDLVVPPDRLEPLLAHLDKYVVMEDVDLEGRPVTVISAQGPRHGELGLSGFACDRLGSGGTDVLDGDRAAAVAAAEALGGGEVSAEAWELARLRAGRPALGRDFDDKTLPQEAGLRDLAVSFTKGCYVGQEVVCMLETRGQLRRRLVQARADALPEPGAEVTADGVAVGTVRSGAIDPDDGRAWIHALIKRKHAVPGAALETATGAMTVREVLGGDSEPPAL